MDTPENTLKRLKADAELGKRLCDMVQVAEDDRSTRRERWDRLRAFYNNEPIVDAKATDDESDLHINVTQVKIDTLAGSVSGTMLGRKPYLLAQTFGKAFDVPTRERILQAFLDKDGIAAAIRKVAPIAGWSNCGWIWSEWHNERQGPNRGPGFVFSVCEPDEVVVYPTTVEHVWDARMVCRRFYRRVKEIEEDQKSGKYLKSDEFRSAAMPDADKSSNYPSSTKDTPHTANDRSDELVKLYRVVFKEDGAWFIATVAYDRRVVLMLDEYGYTRPGLHQFSMKPEPGSIFKRSSVGNDLQGVQIAVNDLARKTCDGITMSIWGVILAAASKMPEEFNVFKGGQIIEHPMAEDAQTYSPAFNYEPVVTFFQFLLSYADSIARVSDAGSGGKSDFDTATEANISYRGQQMALDAIMATFAEGLESLGDWCDECISVHAADWLPVYGDVFGLTDGNVMDFAVDAAWTVNAKASNAHPSATLQAIDRLFQAIMVPGIQIDVYKVGQAMLEAYERMGFLNARDVQLPQDPAQIVEMLSQMVGVDPANLATAIDATKQMEETGYAVADELATMGGPDAEGTQGVLPVSADEGTGEPSAY